MEVKFEVKPMLFEAPTLNALIKKMTVGLSKVSSLHYSYYTSLKINQDEPTARVFKIQKVKQKFKQVGKNESGKTKSVKVRDKVFYGYVYDFKIALLDLALLQLHQNEKSFEIKKSTL